MSFEDSIKRLEEIVDILESGDCKFEDAIKLFEEGKNLASVCSQKLESNKGKIVELVKELDGLVEKSLN